MSNYQDLITSMFTNQNEFNKVVSGDSWVTAGNNWLRCVWIECAEAMGYLEWKWWGKQKLHHDLMIMELVDIFIFGISWCIVRDNDPAVAARSFANVWSHTKGYQQDQKHIPVLVECIAGGALRGRDFDAESFCKILRLLGFSIQDLHKWYIGKNALNQFRQHQGYKVGHYKKVWNGVEDNLVLIDLLHSKKATTMEELLVDLESLYAEVR